jgi:hypothetical protein
VAWGANGMGQGQGEGCSNGAGACRIFVGTDRACQLRDLGRDVDNFSWMHWCYETAVGELHA